MAFLRAVAIMIAVALGLSLIRSVLGSIVRWFTGPDQARDARSREVRDGGVLRKCAACGTYVPETSCIRGGSEWYCSDRCRQTPRLQA